MTKLCSVIIVNWNGLEHLKRCLPALYAQTVDDFEVIIIDNGSDDGSVEWIRQHYSEVQLGYNSENRGFAEANNQGIGLASSPYIVLLNNDTIPSRRWLAALLEAAESNNGGASASNVGMVASQVCFVNAPEILDSAGIEIDALGMAWNRHLGSPVLGEPHEIEEVFGPSGAAALYRRAMLEQIGAFDERYFAYYEDVDLAWRARRAGWRCLYAPQAQVLHVHSATGGRIPGFKAYRLGLNKWRTLFRHYPFWRLAGWLPLLLVIDLFAWLRPLVAYRDTAALRGRVQALRERREFLRERTIYSSPAELTDWICRPSLRRLLMQERHTGGVDPGADGVA
ncbi:MAG: glycosyltransferase [Anaerolineae bacterium]|nr:glycosyltransferase [Anaerolineae bacterium]